MLLPAESVNSKRCSSVLNPGEICGKVADWENCVDPHSGGGADVVVAWRIASDLFPARSESELGALAV